MGDRLKREASLGRTPTPSQGGTRLPASNTRPGDEPPRTRSRFAPTEGMRRRLESWSSDTCREQDSLVHKPLLAWNFPKIQKNLGQLQHRRSKDDMTRSPCSDVEPRSLRPVQPISQVEKVRSNTPSLKCPVLSSPGNVGSIFRVIVPGQAASKIAHQSCSVRLEDFCTPNTYKLCLDYSCSFHFMTSFQTQIIFAQGQYKRELDSSPLQVPNRS
jgi:hypothetical protein